MISGAVGRTWGRITASARRSTRHPVRFVMIGTAILLLTALVGIVGVPSSGDAIETSIARTVAAADAPGTAGVERNAPVHTRAVQDDDSLVHTIVTRVTSGAVRVRTMSRWTLLATFLVLAGFAGLYAAGSSDHRPVPVRVPRSAPLGRREASRAPPLS